MKYFVISDIHSCYDEMIKALKDEGFKENAPDQTLIINGDIWDRGKKSQELKDYLEKVNNKICIIGNHEIILIEAVMRGKFIPVDLLNGVVDTAIQLTGGYDAYEEFKGFNKARDVFSIFYYHVNKPELQSKIINRLIDSNVLDFVVENFYNKDEYGSKGVVRHNKGITILGKPRFSIRINNKIITHGFPLTNMYDALDETDESDWSRYGYGVWANTPMLLGNYFLGNFPQLEEYFKRENIEAVYLGHWDARELEQAYKEFKPVSVVEPSPIFFFTDAHTPSTGRVIVKTFKA